MRYHMVGLGTFLVLYAMFLTPAYFEPTDLIVSSGYILLANQMGIDPIIVYIWAMSGYIALVAGIFLGFGSLVRFKHPLLISLIALFFGGVLFYYFFIHSGIT